MKYLAGSMLYSFSILGKEKMYKLQDMVKPFHLIFIFKQLWENNYKFYFRDFWWAVMRSNWGNQMVSNWVITLYGLASLEEAKQVWDQYLHMKKIS